MVTESADVKWFAMRATYGRNLMAQRLLEMQKIESFVPMQKRTSKVGSRIKTKLVPIVRDLIFVFGKRDTIQDIKGKIPYLHYITRPTTGGRNIPIEVPIEQMQEFIAICNDAESNIEFLSGEEVNFQVGEYVRICQGSLKGRKGMLVKIDGKRTKRFVVAIDGVLAVSVSGIKATDIEHIEMPK